MKHVHVPLRLERSKRDAKPKLGACALYRWGAGSSLKQAGPVGCCGAGMTQWPPHGQGRR
jgi:hypothetical protein